MRKSITSYVPFEHEDFEYKKNILEIARTQDSTLQGVLTSTLIYINAMDYIAAHLLSNLITVAHLITHRELNATVFVSPQEQEKGLPLGDMIKLLRNYEFPDKSEFIQELTEFNKLRIKYVHKLLSMPSAEVIGKIDSDLSQMKGLAENLLQRYDTIVRGITDAWFSYLRRISPTSSTPIPVDKLEEESPITNPDSKQEKDKNNSKK